METWSDGVGGPCSEAAKQNEDRRARCASQPTAGGQHCSAPRATRKRAVVSFREGVFLQTR